MSHLTRTYAHADNAPVGRRLQIVALAIVFFAVVGYAVGRPIVKSIQASNGRAALVQADAAFGHVKVPPGFNRVRTNPQCTSPWPKLCFVASRPLGWVAARMPTILASTGAVPQSTFFRSCGAQLTTNDNCVLAGTSHGLQIELFADHYLEGGVCSAVDCRLSPRKSVLTVVYPHPASQ